MFKRSRRSAASLAVPGLGELIIEFSHCAFQRFDLGLKRGASRNSRPERGDLGLLHFIGTAQPVDLGGACRKPDTQPVGVGARLKKVCKPLHVACVGDDLPAGHDHDRPCLGIMQIYDAFAHLLKSSF
jgi:hypothetical protein